MILCLLILLVRQMCCLILRPLSLFLFHFFKDGRIYESMNQRLLKQESQVSAWKCRSPFLMSLASSQYTNRSLLSRTSHRASLQYFPLKISWSMKELYSVSQDNRFCICLKGFRKFIQHKAQWPKARLSIFWDMEAQIQYLRQGETRWVAARVVKLIQVKYPGPLIAQKVLGREYHRVNF